MFLSIYCIFGIMSYLLIFTPSYLFELGRKPQTDPASFKSEPNSVEFFITRVSSLYITRTCYKPRQWLIFEALPQEGLHCSTLHLWVWNTAEMIPREIGKHQILVLLSFKGVLHCADTLLKCYAGIKLPFLQISLSHTIRVIQIRIPWEFKAAHLVSLLFFNVTVPIWLHSRQIFQPEKVPYRQTQRKALARNIL